MATLIYECDCCGQETIMRRIPDKPNCPKCGAKDSMWLQGKGSML